MPNVKPVGQTQSGFHNVKVGTLATWPPTISSNGRYLVGNNGVPFLIQGDAPQPLFVNVSTSDALTYMQNRQGYGINTLWVNLLCADYTFGLTSGNTFDGVKPFNTGTSPANYDLSTPNSTYFNRMDTFITEAANYGIGFLLDPIETGGWLGCLSNNGSTKAYNYGAFVGARYAGYPNIIWMNGNDFDNPNSTQQGLVESVMQGIHDNTSSMIQTCEMFADPNQGAHFTTSPLDFPTTIGVYTTINNAYTYYPTYDEVLRTRGQSPTMPTFLVEADYEGERNATAMWTRRGQWWTMTCGATGALCASLPAYRLGFGGTDWQGNLTSTAFQHFQYMNNYLRTIPWWDLTPDTTNTVLTSGFGTYNSGTGLVSANDYATCAYTTGKHLALVYTPVNHGLVIALSQFPGSVTAKWLDPTTGVLGSVISGSPFTNTGTHTFTPSATNNAGDADWVLVLTA